MTPHGTTAGYQAHRRARTTPCEPCRAANAEYMRAVRAAHPGRTAADRETAAAYVRATARLRRAHLTEFRRILAEERGESPRPESDRRPTR